MSEEIEIVMRVFIKTKFGQVIHQQYARTDKHDLFYCYNRMLNDAASRAVNEFGGKSVLEKIEFIHGEKK